MTRTLALAFAPSLLLLLASPSPALAASDTPGDAPARLLDRAFEIRYDLDIVQALSVDIHYRDTLVSRQRIEIAGKRIDGRYHALARYRRPAELRGTAVLVIEAEDRWDDQFVYLPSLQRIRRISSAQRADSFFGTDLSYEDIGRPRADRFSLSLATPSTVDGEPVEVVVGHPRTAAGYDRVAFFVSLTDAAILETRHYHRGAEEPFKITRFPREGIHRADGRLIPTQIIVTNPRRGTRTEIRSEQILVNPELEASLFTAAALASARPIPGIAP
jgi:hypothetical protein